MHNAYNIQKWHGHIARKLTEIMHIITRNGQFGYKEGISTSDAKIKVGSIHKTRRKQSRKYYK